MPEIDEKHWTAIKCEDGETFYDADIAAMQKVMSISGILNTVAVRNVPLLCWEVDNG